MRKIRLGMFGGGIGAFIGAAHRRATRATNRYSLVGGVFDVDFDRAKQFAKQEEISVDRCYATVDAFIKGELALPKEQRIEVVSIVTPNALHFSMAKSLLESGFNVVCEKPMTTTVEEAEELQRLVEETGLTFALLHTYTGYPMVRQMRKLIEGGELGNIQRVDAQYYQGWINPIIHGGDIESVWRLNPKSAGISSCVADIGVHAFNLIEYTTGLKAESVLADLSCVSPKVSLDLDATIMMRMDNGSKGLVRTSQVACGEENCLTIAIYGEKAALKWSQEDPNFLYMLSDDAPTKVFKPGHDYNSDFAKMGSTMPSGHPEGIYDAVANIYIGVAKSITKGEESSVEGVDAGAALGSSGVAESGIAQDGEFPTVLDGVRGMKFIYSVVDSNSNGNIWKKI